MSFFKFSSYTFNFKARIKIRAFLLLLVSFFLQVSIFARPVHSFLSSLDTCKSQSTCAQGLAAELEIAKNAVKPFVRSTAKVVSVTAINNTSGATTTTAISTIGGLTVAAAGGTALYLSSDKVESLQGKAFQNYCQNNDVCGEKIFGYTYGTLVGYELIDDGAFINIHKDDGNGGFNISRKGYGDGRVFLKKAVQATDLDPTEDPRKIIIYMYVKSGFNDLSEQQRNDAIDDASVDDLLEAIEVVDLTLPNSLPGELVEVDTDLLLDDDKVIDNPNRKAPPVDPTDPTPDPDPDPDLDPTPDPDPDPDPDLDPTPDPDPDPDPDLDPTPDPDPNPDPDSTPDPTPDPDSTPDPNPDSDGNDDNPNPPDSICLPTSDPNKTTCDIDLDPPNPSQDSGNNNDDGDSLIISPSLELVCDPEDCEKEDNFSVVPFYVYAAEQMQSNPKFPFDIFGDFSTLAVEDKCPQLSLFGYSKDLCFVNDGLRVFKYPIWIAWLIKLALSL